MNTSKHTSIASTNTNSRSTVIILASSVDLTIGKDDTIPWYSKRDLNLFRHCTTGNVIIMGRTTFESLKSKPLPNRYNIVVSRTLNIEATDNLIVCRSIFQAMSCAWQVDLSKFERKTVGEHVFIIGGVMLYESAIAMCDEILYSTIDVSCGPLGYGNEFIINNILPRYTNPSYRHDNTIETEYLPTIPVDTTCRIKSFTHLIKNTCSLPVRFKDIQ